MSSAVADRISALERSLLDPDVRANVEQVADLLADDFEEFGSSGRIWSKAATVAGLASGSSDRTSPPVLSDLKVRLLGDEVALVTYAVGGEAAGEIESRTLRSSVWRNEDGRWRMIFHQGTRADVAKVS